MRRRGSEREDAVPGEERHVEERVRRAPLPGDEAGEGRDAEPDERRPGRRWQPSEAVHEGEEAEAVKDRAGPVEPVIGRLPPLSGDPAAG
jgi:hypothetical protein